MPRFEQTIATLRRSILRWATLVSVVGLLAGCGDPPLGPIREPTTDESGSPSDSPVSQTVSTDLASLGDTVSVEFGIVVPAELGGVCNCPSRTMKILTPVASATRPSGFIMIASGTPASMHSILARMLFR